MRQDVTGFFTMLQGSPGAGWGFGFGRVVWIRSRGAGWGFGVGIRGGDSSPARGGVGIRAPGCGGGWGFGPRTQGVRGFRPERGVGIFWGKMGNFLPFCRFFAVWVEISGQWNLESLPFSGKNGCLGRDFRTAELGISTFFQQKPLFR